jgi:hypothetical protein
MRRAPSIVPNHGVASLNVQAGDAVISQLYALSNLNPIAALTLRGVLFLAGSASVCTPAI